MSACAGYALVYNMRVLALLVCVCCVGAQQFDLDVLAPTSQAVESHACRDHSLLYVQGVTQGAGWALRMLDSSTKFPPSGILMGHLADLGNYDECLGVTDVKTASGSFSGQYCLVTSTVGGTKSGVGLPSLRMQWALCVPSTCSPRDIESHLQSALPGMRATVADSACSSKAHPRQLTAADWFAVGFVSFFLALMLLSTAYDLATSKSEQRRPLLLAYSVYTNGAKLLSTSPGGADSLSSVHGVRFLSMAWVVLGHSYIASLISPSVNLLTIVPYFTDWKHMYLTNATISVDSFFLLSGLLVCYVFLKEMEKPGASFNIPLFYIHRYIRLTPALAAVILLSATLFYYLGDGPLWETYAVFSKQFCQDNWWVNLLYINNYYHADRVCLGQSWYLAVDMQLFWLSPLILYPLWKWPRAGKALWGVMVFAGLLTAFLIPYINEFPANTVAGGGGEMGPKQYFPTHARFTPWLVGIGLGYVLHVTKKTPVAGLTRVTATIGWLLSAGLLLSSFLLGHLFNQPDHTYNRIGDSLYIAYMRTGWVLGLAWVIFACTKGYGGFVNTFLSWQFFQVLGRLTYTVYLIHMTIMMSVASSSKVTQYFSDFNVTMQFLSYLVLSFAAAFVLSLCFESPAIVIEKALLGNRRVEKKDIEGVKNDAMSVADESDKSPPIESLSAQIEPTSAEMKDLEAGVPT